MIFRWVQPTSKPSEPTDLFVTLFDSEMKSFEWKRDQMFLERREVSDSVRDTLHEKATIHNGQYFNQVVEDPKGEKSK